MASLEKFRTYLFSYQHNGARWAFDIKATSPEDARVRLAKIAQASFDGELKASIPVPDARNGWLGLVLRVLWPFR
jgi:hypothetical protein